MELWKEQAVKGNRRASLGEEKIKTREEGKWAERERTSIVDFDIFIMIIGMVPVVCAKPSRMEESERWQVADHRKSS